MLSARESSLCTYHESSLNNNPVSARVSVAMKAHCDHDNSYKGKHLIGAGLQFRGLVHYGHGGKHGNRQTRCWRGS